MEGLPLHPLDIQKKSVGDWRQIGLGVMGIADMLIKLSKKYDTAEAIAYCNTIGQLLAEEAIAASIERAKHHGAYPKYREEYVMESDFITNHTSTSTYDELKKYGMFNSQLLTIAPTGSLSTMLQISGGIEPIFANYYTRTTKSLHGHDETYRVYTKIAKDWMDAHPGKELPDYFVESETIDPIMRVKMQAVWQRHIDASISSTVNLPESTSIETVEEIYKEAWNNGLKGITIFRSGCKRVAILSKKEETSKETVVEIPKPTITDPKNRVGKIRTLTTGCGTLHLTCFFDKYTGQLVETFFAKGSTGGCNNYMNGLSRMISLSAKKGATVDEIIDQLGSTGACPSYVRRTAVNKDTSKGSCCAMAAGYAIKEMYDEMQQELGDCLGVVPENIVHQDKEITSDKPKCPECGAALQMAEGCMSCPTCGYSKCG